MRGFICDECWYTNTKPDDWCAECLEPRMVPIVNICPMCELAPSDAGGIICADCLAEMTPRTLCTSCFYYAPMDGRTLCKYCYAADVWNTDWKDVNHWAPVIIPSVEEELEVIPVLR